MGAANQTNVPEGHSLDTPFEEIFGYDKTGANMEGSLQGRAATGGNSESIQRLAASRKQGGQEKTRHAVVAQA
jgi:hypothetical protein